jgi:pseudouridine-5'-monophosphatase
MDGLLLNTEDMYSLCANTILAQHNRPPLPWPIKAQLMGVPGSSNGDVFHAWARLPISRAQYRAEQSRQQALHFPQCAPLPGAVALLEGLRGARNGEGRSVQLALASSCVRTSYDLKASRAETRRFLDLIPAERRVLGNDPRVGRGRGKPAPDIYLLALEIVNASLPAGEPPIAPGECLVFEDSVPGVEAGRRAGMRVVWVPHPGLAAEYRGREDEVLAGRTGLVVIGDEHQLGEEGDGWAEQLPSLEDFPYERYGIEAPS